MAQVGTRRSFNSARDPLWVKKIDLVMDQSAVRTWWWRGRTRKSVNLNFGSRAFKEV